MHCNLKTDLQRDWNSLQKTELEEQEVENDFNRWRKGIGTSMYLFSINHDKIAETYYSCVLLSWEGCMDLACTGFMTGNSKRLHFWKIPKQNIWLHANSGKIVSEIHRNRGFFRLTLNGEKKHFTAYCYIQPNFPPKVHFQTLPTYSYSTCYASDESREATDRQTDTHSGRAVGAAACRQVPGASLAGSDWGQLLKCVCCTWAAGHNPHIIRPAGTSESQNLCTASP